MIMLFRRISPLAVGVASRHLMPVRTLRWTVMSFHENPINSTAASPTQATPPSRVPSNAMAVSGAPDTLPSAASLSSPSPPSAGDDKQLRKKIQQAVLSEVTRYGWTSLAVEAALQNLSLSPAASAMLPRGIASVAADLEADCNRDLARHLHELQRVRFNFEARANIAGDKNTAESLQKKDDDQYALPPHDDTPQGRVAYAMRHRLTLLDPYHQFWYQSVALRPHTTRQSLRNCLLLIDEIAAYGHYTSPNVRICTVHLSYNSSYVNNTMKHCNLTCVFVST